MGRTAVNVAGQALVPTIVAKREGILDLDRYRSANAADPFSDDDLAVAEQGVPAVATDGVTPGSPDAGPVDVRDREPARA